MRYITTLTGLLLVALLPIVRGYYTSAVTPLDCDEYHTEPSGVITSPNYPSLYPDLADCSYVIDVPSGINISIQFNTFELETCCDYLYYGIGSEAGKNQLGIFYGYEFPAPFVIESGSAWFKLTSDRSETRTGFHLTWTETGYYNTTAMPTNGPMTTDITTNGPMTTDRTTNGPMTTVSDPGEDSPWAHVVCASNIMTAYIARSIIGDVTGDHLHFNDDTCVGTYHNSTHVRISTPYNQCGTVMEVRDDSVVFSNTVVDEALPITPGNVISRERDMLIPVQCHIDRDGLGSISFHADTTQLVFREDGYGKFSFQLQLYQSASYVTPYPPAAYPIDVQLRDRLYFEAGVTAEPGLELFVETCVATSTTSPYSSPQFRFIEDGCSNDNTLQHYHSSNPMLERFGLEAFAFVDKHTPVYVHCFLMICNISDPTSRCTQGCLPAIHKRDVSMRDGHSGSKSYVMSQGPLTFNQHSKEMDVTGSSSSADQWGFLAGSIAFVAMCIAATAMIIIKTRRDVSSDYHALATEEH